MTPDGNIMNRAFFCSKVNSNSLSGSQLKYKKDSQVESPLSSPKNGVLKMQKAALLFLDRPEHPGIDKLFPDLF